jgi:hypothetical protein
MKKRRKWIQSKCLSIQLCYRILESNVTSPAARLLACSLASLFEFADQKRSLEKFENLTRIFNEQFDINPGEEEEEGAAAGAFSCTGGTSTLLFVEIEKLIDIELAHSGIVVVEEPENVFQENSIAIQGDDSARRLFTPPPPAASVFSSILIIIVLLLITGQQSTTVCCCCSCYRLRRRSPGLLQQPLQQSMLQHLRFHLENLSLLAHKQRYQALRLLRKTYTRHRRVVGFTQGTSTTTTTTTTYNIPHHFRRRFLILSCSLIMQQKWWSKIVNVLVVVAAATTFDSPPALIPAS